MLRLLVDSDNSKLFLFLLQCIYSSLTRGLIGTLPNIVCPDRANRRFANKTFQIKIVEKSFYLEIFLSFFPPKMQFQSKVHSEKSFVSLSIISPQHKKYIGAKKHRYFSVQCDQKKIAKCL